MKRITIFGPPGAGKTTFAKQLQEKTGLPLYYIDRYFFLAYWQERPKKDFLQLLQNMVQQEEWIIDGNAISDSLYIRVQQSDTIIYFRLNRLLCLIRVFKRFLKRRLRLQSICYEDRPMNCQEKITWKLIKYVWKFKKRYEPFIEKICAERKEASLYTFSTNAHAKAFLKQIHPYN